MVEQVVERSRGPAEVRIVQPGSGFRVIVFPDALGTIHQTLCIFKQLASRRPGFIGIAIPFQRLDGEHRLIQPDRSAPIRVRVIFTPAVLRQRRERHLGIEDAFVQHILLDHGRRHTAPQRDPALRTLAAGRQERFLRSILADLQIVVISGDRVVHVGIDIVADLLSVFKVLARFLRFPDESCDLTQPAFLRIQIRIQVDGFLIERIANHSIALFELEHFCVIVWRILPLPVAVNAGCIIHAALPAHGLQNLVYVWFSVRLIAFNLHRAVFRDAVMVNVAVGVPPVVIQDQLVVDLSQEVQIFRLLVVVVDGPRGQRRLGIALVP